jgi:hypothetical protein
MREKNEDEAYLSRRSGRSAVFPISQQGLYTTFSQDFPHDPQALVVRLSD